MRITKREIDAICTRLTRKRALLKNGEEAWRRYEDEINRLVEAAYTLQKQSDGLLSLVRELLPLAGPCTCPHLKDCPHKRAQAVLAYLDSIEEGQDGG